MHENALFPRISNVSCFQTGDHFKAYRGDLKYESRAKDYPRHEAKRFYEFEHLARGGKSAFSYRELSSLKREWFRHSCRITEGAQLPFLFKGYFRPYLRPSCSWPRALDLAADHYRCTECMKRVHGFSVTSGAENDADVSHDTTIPRSRQLRSLPPPLSLSLGFFRACRARISACY